MTTPAGEEASPAPSCSASASGSELQPGRAPEGLRPGWPRRGFGRAWTGPKPRLPLTAGAVARSRLDRQHRTELRCFFESRGAPTGAPLAPAK